MSDIKLIDNLNLEGITVPAKTPESELWLAKDPTFCPRCVEIRGEKDKASLLLDPPEILAWKSFGMCQLCYIFQRDNPELAKANQEKYKLEQEEKKRNQLADQKAHRFRVYFLDNAKWPSSPFAESVTDEKFTRWPETTARGEANKSDRLFKEEDAKKIVEILLSKDLVAWYDDSEYQKLMEK